MKDKADDFARRAAEEFIAASRASTPEDRAVHRASALAYVALRDRPSRHRVIR